MPTSHHFKGLFDHVNIARHKIQPPNRDLVKATLGENSFIF